jgi:hypothetical protein
MYTADGSDDPLDQQLAIIPCFYEGFGRAEEKTRVFFPTKPEAIGQMMKLKDFGDIEVPRGETGARFSAEVSNHFRLLASSWPFVADALKEELSNYLDAFMTFADGNI